METSQILGEKVDVWFIAQLVRIRGELYGRITSQNRPFYGLRAGDLVEVTLLAYRNLDGYQDLYFSYRTEIVGYDKSLYFPVLEEARVFYRLKISHDVGTSIVARLVKRTD